MARKKKTKEPKMVVERTGVVREAKKARRYSPSQHPLRAAIQPAERPGVPTAFTPEQISILEDLQISNIEHNVGFQDPAGPINLKAYLEFVEKRQRRPKTKRAAPASPVKRRFFGLSGEIGKRPEQLRSPALRTNQAIGPITTGRNKTVFTEHTRILLKDFLGRGVFTAPEISQIVEHYGVAELPNIAQATREFWSQLTEKDFYTESGQARVQGPLPAGTPVQQVEHIRQWAAGQRAFQQHETVLAANRPVNPLPPSNRPVNPIIALKEAAPIRTQEEVVERFKHLSRARGVSSEVKEWAADERGRLLRIAKGLEKESAFDAAARTSIVASAFHQPAAVDPIEAAERAAIQAESLPSNKPVNPLPPSNEPINPLPVSNEPVNPVVSSHQQLSMGGDFQKLSRDAEIQKLRFSAGRGLTAETREKASARLRELGIGEGEILSPLTPPVREHINVAYWYTPSGQAELKKELHAKLDRYHELQGLSRTGTEEQKERASIQLESDFSGWLDRDRKAKEAMRRAGAKRDAEFRKERGLTRRRQTKYSYGPGGQRYLPFARDYIPEDWKNARFRRILDKAKATETPLREYIDPRQTSLFAWMNQRGPAPAGRGGPGGIRQKPLRKFVDIPKEIKTTPAIFRNLDRWGRAAKPPLGQAARSIAQAEHAAPVIASLEQARGLNKFLKVGLGIGAGVAAFGLFFSGRDDNYNTIPGMQHGGMAGKMRRENTDFGSGYKDEKQPKFNTKALLAAGGISLGAAALFRNKEAWINEPLDVQSYLRQFERVSYRPGDIIFSRNVLYDDPFHTALVGADMKVYESYLDPLKKGKAKIARYGISEYLEHQLKVHGEQGLQYPLFGVGRVKGATGETGRVAGKFIQNVFEQYERGEIAPAYGLKANQGLNAFNCLSLTAEAYKQAGKDIFQPGTRYAVPWNLGLDEIEWVTKGPQKALPGIRRTGAALGALNLGLGIATVDPAMIGVGAGGLIGSTIGNKIVSNQPFVKALPLTGILLPDRLKKHYRKGMALAGATLLGIPALYNLANKTEELTRPRDSKQGIPITPFVGMAGLGYIGFEAARAFSSGVKYDPKSKRLLIVTEAKGEGAQGHLVPGEAVKEWLGKHGWEAEIMHGIDDLSRLSRDKRAYRAFLDTGYVTPWVPGLPGVIAQWDVQSQYDTSRGRFRAHISPGIGLGSKGVIYAMPGHQQAKEYAETTGQKNFYAFDNLVVRPSALRDAKATRSLLRAGKLNLPHVSVGEPFITISGGGKGFGVPETVRLLHESKYFEATGRRALIFSGYLKTNRPKEYAELLQLTDRYKDRYTLFDFQSPVGRRLPEYMAAADINVFVPGASTTVEAISAEKPFVGIYGKTRMPGMQGNILTTAGIPTFGHFETHPGYARERYGAISAKVAIPGLREPGEAAAKELRGAMESVWEEFRAKGIKHVPIEEFDVGKRLISMIEQGERAGHLRPTRLRGGLSGAVLPLWASGGFRKALGIGVVALGAAKIWDVLSNKPVNKVPGKDDRYNKIHGMQERGVSALRRKQDTDFGSGYRGQKDQDGFITPSTVLSMGLVAGGAGYLGFKSMQHMKNNFDTMHIDVPGLQYDPASKRILMLAEEIPGFAKGHIQSAEALKAWVEKHGWDVDLHKATGKSLQENKKILSSISGRYRTMFDAGYMIPWANQLPVIATNWDVLPDYMAQTGEFRQHLMLGKDKIRERSLLMVPSQHQAEIYHTMQQGSLVHAFDTLVAHPRVVEKAFSSKKTGVLPGLKQGEKYITISGGGIAVGVPETARLIQESGWLEATGHRAVIFGAQLETRDPTRYAALQQIIARNPSQFVLHDLTPGGPGWMLPDYMRGATVNLSAAGGSTAVEAVLAGKPFIGHYGGPAAGFPKYFKEDEPLWFKEHPKYMRERYGLPTEYVFTPGLGVKDVSQAAKNIRSKLESVITESNRSPIRLPSSADFDAGRKLIDLIESAEKKGILGAAKKKSIMATSFANKVGMVGAGIATAVGLYNLFSGKDDSHNTIEGLPHGGEAEKSRRRLTEFGSGWTGLAGRTLLELGEFGILYGKRHFLRGGDEEEQEDETEEEYRTHRRKAGYGQIEGMHHRSRITGGMSMAARRRRAMTDFRTSAVLEGARSVGFLKMGVRDLFETVVGKAKAAGVKFERIYDPVKKKGGKIISGTAHSKRDMSEVLFSRDPSRMRQSVVMNLGEYTGPASYFEGAFESTAEQQRVAKFTDVIHEVSETLQSREIVQGAFEKLRTGAAVAKGPFSLAEFLEKEVESQVVGTHHNIMPVFDEHLFGAKMGMEAYINVRNFRLNEIMGYAGDIKYQYQTLRVMRGIEKRYLPKMGYTEEQLKLVGNIWEQESVKAYEQDVYQRYRRGWKTKTNILSNEDLARAPTLMGIPAVNTAVNPLPGAMHPQGQLSPEENEFAKVLHATTPFKGQHDRLKHIAQLLGQEFEEVLASKAFHEALKAGTHLKTLSSGEYGTVSLFETIFGGKKLHYVEKTILPGAREGLMSKVREAYGEPMRQAEEQVRKLLGQVPARTEDLLAQGGGHFAVRQLARLRQEVTQHYKTFGIGLSLEHEAAMMRAAGHEGVVPTVYGLSEGKLYQEAAGVYEEKTGEFRLAKSFKELKAQPIATRTLVPRSSMNQVLEQAQSNIDKGFINWDVHGGNILYDEPTGRIWNVDYGVARTIRKNTPQSVIERHLEDLRYRLKMQHSVLQDPSQVREFKPVVRTSEDLEESIDVPPPQLPILPSSVELAQRRVSQQSQMQRDAQAQMFSAAQNGGKRHRNSVARRLRGPSGRAGK